MAKKQDMPLHKRQYECPHCSMSLDRDTNSAINILRCALEQGTAETDKIFLSMKARSPKLNITMLVQGSSLKQKAQY